MTTVNFRNPVAALSVKDVAHNLGVIALPEDGWTRADDLALVEATFRHSNMTAIALQIGKPREAAETRFRRLAVAATGGAPMTLTAQSRLLEAVRGLA